MVEAVGRWSLVVLVTLVLAAACSGDSTLPTTSTVSTPSTTTAIAPSSTSQPPEPLTTTAPPTTQGRRNTAQSSGPVGVVGCSNTAMAVAGYGTVSDRDLLTQGGLTGGSIGVWGNPGPARYQRYWGMYDDRRPTTGYEAAWVQLCIRDREHSGSFNRDQQIWIEHIVVAIHERDPGIPIWISGVNTFEEGLVCPTVGADGPAIAAEAADWAVSSISGLQRGPDLGPMVSSHLDPGETCHPNALGQAFMGSQLADFFDD